MKYVSKAIFAAAIAAYVLLLTKRLGAGYEGLTIEDIGIWLLVAVASHVLFSTKAISE